ncbi:MAG: hypothetical protein RR813_04545 [Enterococcus sp.]
MEEKEKQLADLAKEAKKDKTMEKIDEMEKELQLDDDNEEKDEKETPLPGANFRGPNQTF